MLIDVAPTAPEVPPPRHLSPEPPPLCIFDTTAMFMQTESHFKSVLNTNYAASAAERGQIRELLIQPLEELARLNTEISRLKSTLTYLLSHRERLQIFVNSHKALISPIRRLPDEILSEIFLYCLPHDRNPTRSTGEAPLLLTLVCERWREVALSTARLWTALHIYLPPRPQKYEQTFSQLLERRSMGMKTWFSRSGSLPVSFSLVVGLSRENRQGQTMYKSILDTLFEFRKRWGDVMLRVPSAILTSIEETVKPEEVPLLKTLVVDYDIASRQLLIDGSQDGTQLEERALPLGDFICRAPALQELTLLDPIQNIYAIPMDWSKLTHFKSETVLGSIHSPKEVLDVMTKGAPNLRSVSITAGFRPPYTPMPEVMETVTLPFLHTLHLQLQFDIGPPPFGVVVQSAAQDQNQPNTYGAQVSSIFEGIRAPNLQNLSIRFSNVIDQPGALIPPSVPFLQFLLSSQCKLQSLDVNFVMSRDALITCLEAVPTLKSLSVDECLWTVLRDRQRAASILQTGTINTTPEEKAQLSLITDELLLQLSPSSENLTPLCPVLERVTFSRCHETLTEGQLVEFVKSRQARPTVVPSASSVGEDQCLAVTKPTPLRALNVAYYREKMIISEEDMQSRKEMKLMKKVMEVSIAYPRPTMPSDLPHTGQQLNIPRRGAFAFASTLWE
ncbi:hypothetical protein Moror_1720 [Moniliophthora roreri MCA 2997]|uniref:F-box domain-containing protein n=1 Tax=Moniliophthora roreri (strain MCA 2997) TaxID=1381753 RepID=V2YP31_MONRO|nr:hypothetical protein Moror_1720 [Moniliophthora roreri MCA 2997]